MAWPRPLTVLPSEVLLFSDYRLKLKPDFQTWAIVLHFELSTMQLSDGSDKAESKAMTRAAPASLDPVEPLENVLTLLERNAGPTISDRNHGALVSATSRDLDVPSAVRDGIVDESGDRVEQEIPVAIDPHPSAAFEFHAATLFFGRGVK